jgi:hypothetical protein
MREMRGLYDVGIGNSNQPRRAPTRDFAIKFMHNLDYRGSLWESLRDLEACPRAQLETLYPVGSRGGITRNSLSARTAPLAPSTQRYSTCA